jgi:hypothetical protein
MDDSSLKHRSRLKRAAQHGNLVRRQGPGWKLFERAQGDAVGLAQGPANQQSIGTSFRPRGKRFVEASLYCKVRAMGKKRRLQEDSKWLDFSILRRP